ncbi:MAG: hypothetical protein R6X14_01765 [bacterium]
MNEPTLRFRPPVLILRPVMVELCRLARDGYETPRKREAFGFLYGRLSRQGKLEVRKAISYRGGRRTRSGVCFDNPAAILRAFHRRWLIARTLGMRFLGGFHSHVEIAGRVSCGLSREDLRSFRSDFEAGLEALVMVWAGGRRDAGGPNVISIYEESTGYSYRLRVYAKRTVGIRRVGTRLAGDPRTGHSLILP